MTMLISATRHPAPLTDERTPALRPLRQPAPERVPFGREGVEPPLRSPTYGLKLALLAATYHPVCDCGQPARHVVQFWQLNADCTGRYLNALVVCLACAHDWDEPVATKRLEDVYAEVGWPLPSSLAALAQP